MPVADKADRPPLSGIPLGVRKARDVLADYAKAIENGRRATLTGTTASDGTPQYRLQLSEKRANAVRDLLISLGAPAGAITTRGVGSDFPGYVPDRDPQGNLNPSRQRRTAR